MTEKKKLKRNINLFYLIRALSKRPYVPLIGLYAVGVIGVSLKSFGIILALSSAFGLVFEIPSGYISDKLGHKRTLLIGAIFIAIGPWFYVVTENLVGITLALIVNKIGSAFYSGTLRALAHNSLIGLGKEESTSSVFMKGEAIGLFMASLFFIILPLVFSESPRLPFILSACIMGLGIPAVLNLHEPETHETARAYQPVSLGGLFAMIKIRHIMIFALLVAFWKSVAYSLLNFREIYLEALSFPIEQMGMVAAAGSLIGALVAYQLKDIKEVTIKKYFTVQSIALTLLLLTLGLVGNVWLAVILIIMWDINYRATNGLVKALVIRETPIKSMKASFMSLIEFCVGIFFVIIPVLLGFLFEIYGTQRGMLILVPFVGTFIALLLWVYMKEKKSV